MLVCVEQQKGKTNRGMITTQGGKNFVQNKNGGKLLLIKVPRRSCATDQFPVTSVQSTAQHANSNVFPIETQKFYQNSCATELKTN
jgi:hypothetical protein